jgi:hypothetical protein
MKRLFGSLVLAMFLCVSGSYALGATKQDAPEQDTAKKRRHEEGRHVQGQEEEEKGQERKEGTEERRKERRDQEAQLIGLFYFSVTRAAGASHALRLPDSFLRSICFPA